MSTFIDAQPRAIGSGLPAQVLRTVVSSLWQVFAMVRHWHGLAGERHHLAELESHRLADIGVTADEAEQEARKPFWVE